MKKLIATIVAFILGFSSIATPAMAISSPITTFGDTAQTAILTECAEDDGKGGSILCLLRQAVNILSVAVGIVGAIGITIVGIQYLTAGGNEEQTRKAKRRLFEIVIGLAVYVLISALLSFLLPTYSGS
ncbi:hypothetical protein IJH33_02555 [Candidatus Saccharibacteria bacterium]|nr:hypothetical protein [Candidatus Saccharibacteria bacterium]